jgi:hypothetical protein
MEKEAKVQKRRLGPAIKDPKEKRVPLGLMVSNWAKQRLNAVAKRDDVTLSVAAEQAIQRGLIVDEITGKSGVDLEKLAVDQVWATLRARGWTTLTTKIDGKVETVLRVPGAARTTSTWGEAQ